MSFFGRDSALARDEAIEYPRISKPTSFYIYVWRINPIKVEKSWRILESKG
jgi:hypothetical protein